jgi:nucleotide-binding universal stress UspA family protein
MTSNNEKASTTHLVVGLDKSQQSVAALRWAATYANRTGAHLRLVHVWELDDSAMFGTTLELRQTITQDARATLTKLVTDTLGSTVETGAWRLDVVEGPIGPTLVELAKDADLLVLGTGEHTGVRRLVAGSVSHYCLSHARGPVLAVPVTAAYHHADVPREAEMTATAPVVM